VRGWIVLTLCGLMGGPSLAQRVIEPLPDVPPQALIYDDDCSQDVDCVATLPILHALEDRGEIRILAMVASSADPLTAAVMKIFAKQGGHPEMVIGANQSDDPATEQCKKNGCNTSVWAEKLVARFDAGDSRAKYAGCAAVYRKALAGAPEHSVAVVVTGFATCLNQLLATKADAVSPLSGAELVKRKVKLLSVMGGRYPAGSEWNFQSDAPGFHALFHVWTRQNGYPPVYLNGFENGEHILAGAPAGADPKVNPTKYAMQVSGTEQRPMWDMLSALFAARGLAFGGTAYFKVGAAGTVEVDGVTGWDTWSGAADSGHYVLTKVAGDEVFEGMFDGYAHPSGFLARKSAAKP
jgi:hypothetical protein